MSSSKNNLSHAWLMATWILGGSEMLGPATTKNSLKINMEPQNHPLEKENHLPSLHLLCSMLIFQGVPFLTRIFRETSWACWRPAARVCLWAELRVPPILPICSMYDIRVDGSEVQKSSKLTSWYGTYMKISQYSHGFYTSQVVVGDFATINSSNILYNTLISLCTRSGCEVPGSFYGRPNDIAKYISEHT